MTSTQNKQLWFLPYLNGPGKVHNLAAATCWNWPEESPLPPELQGCVFHQFFTNVQDPALPLPLAEASQDFLLATDVLENLRMDQLYMVLSEARRVIKPGGRLFLRSTVKRWRSFDLTHYISPEDWKEVHQSWERRLWITQQILVLERL